MGATEEQMALVAESSMDHVSYILILYSCAFLMFLFANMLIHLYDRNMAPKEEVHVYALGGRDDEALRDAEEFELDGLVSDGEDEGRVSKEGRAASPGSVGSSGGAVRLRD